MATDLLNGVLSLADFGHGLVGKISVLSFVLLFFLAVNCLIVFFGRKLSPVKVKSTIKLALLGFLVVLLDMQLRFPPPYARLPADVATLVAMLCAANFISYIVVDVYFFHRMDRQVPSNVRDLANIAVYLLFAMAALRVVFRIELSSILTTTTVLTAAVALAMQTTLANIASSFYVQNDENLRRGTWISLPGSDLSGEIVDMGFRYTTLRTLDNQRILVPNNHIMQNIVRTHGAGKDGEKTAAHLKVGLAYEMPPELVVGMLRRILLEEEHVLKDPEPTVLVGGFLDSSVEYDLKYYLDDYAFHVRTRGSLLNKIWYAVGREGYGIPFPHRETIVKVPRVPFAEERDAVPGLLRRAEILESLDGEEIRKLSERVHVRVFGPGETVVRKGDGGASLFIVRRGTLEVRIDGAAVGTLGEGDVFGEMSLLTGERRGATVSARSEARLVEISKEDIEPAIRANPRLLESLSALLARRQAANLERMKAAGQPREAEGKEAFLVKLKAFFGLSRG
ncbi:MAG: mechanosensitive ion channel family protein [Thermodesulfobacteriota bacterium]